LQQERPLSRKNKKMPCDIRFRYSLARLFERLSRRSNYVELSAAVAEQRHEYKASPKALKLAKSR
jgi:hypothetical protein